MFKLCCPHQIDKLCLLLSIDVYHQSQYLPMGMIDSDIFHKLLFVLNRLYRVALLPKQV